MCATSAPFAKDSAGSLQPTIQAHPHAASSCDVDNTSGGDNRKQEIVSKVPCASDAPTGAALAASAGSTALEEAGLQRQREEEEWKVAKAIMEEQREDEREREEHRCQHDAEARVAKTAAARALQQPVEENKTHADDPAAYSPANDVGGVATLPIQIAEEALESMSKKELVLLVQRIATAQVLQANQLSGNPNNVAKKASKEKVDIHSNFSLALSLSLSLSLKLFCFPPPIKFLTHSFTLSLPLAVSLSLCLHPSL